MVLKEGLALTAAGLVVGFWLAAGIGMLVGSMLYEVSAFDPAVFLAAPLLLAVASLAACYLPALRATRIQPTVALRTEYTGGRLATCGFRLLAPGCAEGRSHEP